ncbi:MAG: 30S ribosomal protein S20 [Patescibacteria group bacterium]|nr:30S ribosomal protein S20 [Patescibacteria group bacterium]MBU1876739.1 30S ribosomal protein S20 [Patescibacteria group bacterium]
MPITKSAKKALRQSKRRRTHNIQKKKTMRELIKKFKQLIAEKKKDEAKALLPQIYKVLDKAAKTNLIKKNTGSRKKSRITKMVNKA